MATTLAKISELCARDYARLAGRDRYSVTEKALIKTHILKAVNELLGLVTLEGNGDIPNCMIATYTAITPQDEGSVKYIDLPAYPLNLPLDKGVWEVSADSPLASPYIPFPSAFRQLLGSEDEGTLEGFTGWVLEGNKIYFTEAPAGNVRVKLLVADPAKIGDDDPLPLPPEFEGKVYDMVMERMVRTGKSAE